MAQFDVYHNRSDLNRDMIPYLLDVQSDLLAQLSTRLVIPMYRVACFGPPSRGLNPTIQIAGEMLVLSPPEMAGVAVKTLGAYVGSLEEYRVQIIGAIDMLITGI